VTDLPRHYEARAIVDGPAEEIFALVDEPDFLMRHMSRPTLMMGGGAVRCDVDALGGKAPGSVIHFKGTAFGLGVDAAEIIEVRIPPIRKVWATTATPRLVVVSDYRMGFEITTVPGGSDLHVWIDYALPPRGLYRLLGWFLGPMFARWCVQNMIHEVERCRQGKPT